MATENGRKELCLASVQTKSEFGVLEHLTDRRVLNVCASDKKMFVLYEDDNGERRTVPLHQPEIDELDATITENTIFSQQGDQSYRLLDLNGYVGKTADISCSKTTTLLVNDEGKTFIFGYGSLGALGQGVRAVCSKPVLVSKLEGLRICSIATGDNHCLALSDLGDVYSWGRGIEGQLAQKNFRVTAYPTRCSYFDTIDLKEQRALIRRVVEDYGLECLAKESCPPMETINKVLSDYRDDTTYKSNAHEEPAEEAGLEELQRQSLMQPNIRASRSKYKSFSINELKSLAVEMAASSIKKKNSASMVACPLDNSGQPIDPKKLFADEIHRAIQAKMEKEGKETSKEDQLLMELQEKFGLERLLTFEKIKVIKIYAAANHSFAVTNLRTLFGWGESLCGQLGLPIKTGYYAPTLVPLKELVLDIYSRKTHTLMLSTDMNLYAAGLNNYGQVGVGSAKHVAEFRRLETDLDGNPLPKFKFAATTACYSIAVSLKNQVYCWGKCFLDTNSGARYPKKKVFPGMGEILSLHAMDNLVLVSRIPPAHRETEFEPIPENPEPRKRHTRVMDSVKREERGTRSKMDSSDLRAQSQNERIWEATIVDTSRPDFQDGVVAKAEGEHSLDHLK